MKIKEKWQIKATEEHVKYLFESNELIENGFNIDRDTIPFEEQTKFNEFRNLEKKINSDNLINK